MSAPTRGQRRPMVLLRPVPGDSVIHQLWAGTKLLAVAGIGVLLTFYPGWVPIAFVAVLVLVVARLAHIPRGAVPSVPFWLWVLLALGAATATCSPGRRSIDSGPSASWSTPGYRNRTSANRAGTGATVPVPVGVSSLWTSGTPASRVSTLDSAHQPTRLTRQTLKTPELRISTGQ